MSATEPLPRPRRKWFRFFLGGMLIFTLGMSAGLANYRAAEENFFNSLFEQRWPSTLLACFSMWLVVGLAQAAWKTFRRYRLLGDVEGPYRWGFLIQILQPLLALLLALVSFAINRIPITVVDGLQNMYKVQAADLLFYLAVVIAYAPTQRLTQVARVKSIGLRRAVGGMTIVLALIWLAFLVTGVSMTVTLVGTALRGMEMAKLSTVVVSGRHVSPHDFSADGPFIAGGIAAGAISAGLLLLLAAVTVTQPQQRRLLWREAIWLILWLMLMVGGWWLLAWCATDGLPKVSPHLAAQALNIPPVNLFLLAVILLAATCLFAARGSSVPVAGELSSPALIPVKTPVHQLRIVQFLFLFSALWAASRVVNWSFADDWSERWERLQWMIGNQFMEPAEITRVAAIIVVSVAFVQSFRQPQTYSTTIALNPRRFAALALLWLITLVTIAPLLLWFGATVIFWI